MTTEPTQQDQNVYGLAALGETAPIRRMIRDVKARHGRVTAIGAYRAAFPTVNLLDAKKAVERIVADPRADVPGPAAALRELIERNNAEVYEGGGNGVWGDPDGGMLRYSAALLVAIGQHDLTVECGYWTCSTCGPLGYTDGRPCWRLAEIADVLDVAS